MERITYVLWLITMATFHRNMTQIYIIYIVDIYYTYIYTCIPHTHARIHTRTLGQHHFQVQEIEKNFCDNSFLQVFTGGLRTVKCCCYVFLFSQFRKQSVTIVTGLCYRCLFCIAHKKQVSCLLTSFPRREGERGGGERKEGGQAELSAETPSM